MRIPFLVLALALAASPVRADNDGAKFPRFVSLKADRVFMREGPAMDSRIKWIYHRQGLPVEALAGFDVWLRVRDMGGAVGWIHRSMLSSERTAIVTGKGDVALRAKAAPDAAPSALVQPGAVGRLVACKVSACELRFGDTEGWLDRTRLWGVYANEKF
jgi:SH3-like domain-containing protein